MSKPNPTHRALPLAEVLRWRQEAARRGVSEVARGPGGFLPAYEAAGGSLGRMSPWWRARREAFLARHLAQVAAHHERLFESDGLPTRRHLALVMWAYSPAPSRLPRGPTMRHPNPRAPGRWFHGTSLEAAEKILAAGRIEAPRELAPHYTGRTAQWFAPMQGYVYLTNDIEIGLKYAHMRAYKGRGKYGMGALIEVMPDEPCLPDEDEIGQALAIVLFDDQSQPVDDRDDVAALGRAVLEAVPRPLRKRWEASGARAAGWTGARKAKEGKAAIAALAPHVIDALAGKTRSIACVGATPLKAVAVPPRYYELVRPIQAEELARREREMGRERAIWADYVAIKPRVYERFFDESEPILTPMRHANPIVSPTHEPIWSCPSGPGHIVDWLRAHYEPEDASTIFVAVGGWRAVADAMCTGGWKSREDFENDWDVRWHMVENPEGGRPLYVVVSGGIENVFAPEGVDVDDLIRWADAWEEREG